MKTESIRFTNADDVQLAAKLDLPESGDPVAYALFAHCFTCTKNLSAVRAISRGLTDQGFGVLSFDFTGLGQSEGEFAETDFSSQSSDLLQAAAYLRESRGSGPALMIGHSLGGTATLYAARQLPEVVAVATIGAPAHPAHVTALFSASIDTIEAQGEAEVSIGGRPFCLKKRFLDDVREHPPESWLPGLNTNIMIFHSPVDAIVGIENAEHIYKAVKHPKSFVSLDRADHLLSNPDDAGFVAQVVGAWSRALLSRAAADTPEITEAEVWFEPDAEYQVAGKIGQTHYRTELSNSRHHLLADEPQSVGGADLGGAPFDYLLWALAACKLMTVRMYVDRKGWALGELRIQLRHKKVKAAQLGFDPALAQETRGLADHIEVQLQATGELTEEQRGRLVEISRMCPVSRTLKSPTKIDVTLA